MGRRIADEAAELRTAAEARARLSLLAAHALQVDRPYWVPVSCLAIIQGASLRAAWSRHLQRIVGTAVGLLVFAGIALVPLGPWGVAAVLTLLALVIETLVVRHYGLADKTDPGHFKVSQLAVDQVTDECRHRRLVDRLGTWLAPARPRLGLAGAAVTADLVYGRRPVREALRRLEGYGVLQLRPGRSAVVAPIDTDDLRSIYRLRTLIEVDLAEKRTAIFTGGLPFHRRSGAAMLDSLAHRCLPTRLVGPARSRKCVVPAG